MRPYLRRTVDDNLAPHAPGLRPGATTLLLPGRAGELRIRWRLPRRSSSFDGVTAALIRAYRERRLKPPG